MPISSKKSAVSIFIVSGGRCLAAHTMVRSLLVQYPENKISVRVFPGFSSVDDIKMVIDKAKNTNTIIVHTLVSSELREDLINSCLC
jgi:regulator of PEP synthase PpsR (kinase-PPPase family)